jgi:carboxymethylenebutenolidase
MGGALTLLGSLNSEIFSCGAPFYGIPGNDAIHKITIPIQGHFGEKDQMKGFSDVEAVKKLENGFKDNNKENYELFIYEGAGHGFTNDVILF